MSRALLLTIVAAITLSAGVRETVSGRTTAWTPVEASFVAQVIENDPVAETVYITNTGRKFHRGTCRYLKKSKIKIDKKDAISRGYTACKVCKP